MGGILQNLSTDQIRKRWLGFALKVIFFIQLLITERTETKDARIVQCMVFVLLGQLGCI